MTRTSAIRHKVLRAMRLSAHRYDRYRAASLTLSLAILFAVPLSGLARVDLWRGRHLLGFERVPVAHGVAGVVLAIAALYVVTFLSNVVAGRMFCGWGCPVGQLNRFGETREAKTAKPRARLGAAVFRFLFVLSILCWWVDPSVLVQGSPAALASGWGALALGYGVAYAQGRWWGFGFCMQACPIGLYYSFVSPAKRFGVHFRNRDRSCVECGACDNVCPVGLAPRDLFQPVPARGGLSIADAPGRNHCLECADCVRACEMVIGRRGGGPVPLRLGRYRGAQREEAAGAAGGVKLEEHLAVGSL